MTRFLRMFGFMPLQFYVDPPGPGGTPPAPAPAPAGETVSKAEFDKLVARLAALEPKPPPPSPAPAPKPEDDLAKKAELEAAAKAKKVSDNKALEAGIKFNLNCEKFLSENSALLPKEVKGIVDQANKENYESELDKADAIKAAMIKQFFSVQANLDFLTPAIKSRLDEFLKLTDAGRKEKARETWDDVFEPTFEMIRKVKKAEAVGTGKSDGSEDALKTKMMTHSKKTYLGEKANA